MSVKTGFIKLMKSSILMGLMTVIMLSGCSQKAISGTNVVDGCLVFEMGYPSVKDTKDTILWFENHNDIFKYFCLGVENEIKINIKKEL